MSRVPKRNSKFVKNVLRGDFDVCDYRGLVDAAVWDDLRVPITATRVGATNPPGFDVFIGATRAYAFVDTAVAGNEEQLYFVAQIPHEARSR